ncbi:competence/damage-inducible protein A [Bacillus salitolerans]|uniref:Putative competence-damage inducible protein n=1 Tax=Bacillus salitolerans TaxID=1437434 RepID=A0ABW4LL64_9BACI
MNAEIIAVGTELLLGQITNTNAQFLSKQLAELGINVYYHTVVGDNQTRLKSAIEIAKKRADLLIFTGGLGPTKDDLTKETISSSLKRSLVMDEEALLSIEDYYKKINREMSENNRKQALVIEGSEVLPNKHGMAPGMLVSIHGKSYMLLPGPPKEMQPMFIEFGCPAIMKQLKIQERIESRVLRFFGIGESQLETDISDLIDSQTNPTIAPLASDYEVTLRLTAKHGTSEGAKKLLDMVEKDILSRVGRFFYGYNDTTLCDEVIKMLTDKSLTISSAESLTGGLFSESLTRVSGASSIVKGGIVCYTNEIKQSVLQVSEMTLSENGSVSERCARELAINVKSCLSSNIGISFTGVAGPEELEGKPVGTVYIGIALPNDKVKIYNVLLAGSRQGIRERAVKYGLHYLLEEIKNL